MNSFLFIGLYMKTILDKIYTIDKSNDRLGSQEIMRFIELNFGKNDLQTIDDMLRYININKLSNRSAMVIVRVSSRMKHKLKNWKNTFEKVKVKLGPDADRLLIGMKED